MGFKATGIVDPGWVQSYGYRRRWVGFKATGTEDAGWADGGGGWGRVRQRIFWPEPEMLLLVSHVLHG